MVQRLYEFLWELVTDVGRFSHCEWKVFQSDAEVRRYGKKRECELNDGHGMEVRAEEGYYYRYLGATGVNEIDGYRILVESTE